MSKRYYAKDISDKKLSIYQRAVNWFKKDYIFEGRDKAYTDLIEAEKNYDTDRADAIYTMLLEEDPFGVFVYRTDRFAYWWKVLRRIDWKLGEGHPYTAELLSEVLETKLRQDKVILEDDTRLSREQVITIFNFVKGREDLLEDGAKPVNRALILARNRIYLSGLGTSEAAINRLENAGYLNKVLLQSLDNTSEWEKKFWAEIEKDEESGTRAKMKAATVTNSSISKIVRGSKESKEDITKYILEFFNDMGKFEVRETKESNSRHSWKYLLIWDKDGNRIYHTKKFKTIKKRK